MKGGIHHVENIVQKHDNIFMAHMGHIMKNEGNEYWTSLSPSGNIQHILRANYQKRKEETLDVPLTAMLRYYTFEPDENIVNAFTYNVTMNKYYRDKDHQFSFSYNMDSNAEME
jgi:DNA-directed RNA polymerase beta subunit